MDEEHLGEEAEEDFLHQVRDLAPASAFVVDVKRENSHGGGEGDDGYGDAVVQTCAKETLELVCLLACRVPTHELLGPLEGVTTRNYS